MKTTGSRLGLLVLSLSLAACDQVVSAKGPATVVTRDDIEGTCISLIKLDADSHISIDGETLSLAGLTARLENRAADDPCEIVVQADKNVDADAFSAVLKTINDVSPAPGTSNSQE